MSEWQSVLIDQDVDAAIQVMRQPGQTYNEVLRKVFGLLPNGIAVQVMDTTAFERFLMRTSSSVSRVLLRASCRVVNPRDPNGRAYRAVLVEGKQVVWTCPHEHHGFRLREAALACAERERCRRMQEGTSVPSK